MYVLKPGGREDFIWQRFQYSTAPLDTKYSLWHSNPLNSMSSRWVWLSQYLSTHRCHSVLVHSMCWTSRHKAEHHLCRKGVGMRYNMWAKESVSRLLKPTIISLYKHIHKTSLSFTWSESIPLQVASGPSVLLCGEKTSTKQNPPNP